MVEPDVATGARVILSGHTTSQHTKLAGDDDTCVEPLHHGHRQVDSCFGLFLRH